MSLPFHNRLLRLFPVWGCAAFCCSAAANEFTAEQLQFFENKVRPVLAQHCTKCHGPERQNNGLRLDSRASVIKGSAYGPVVEPGKPDSSKLIKAIRHEAGVEAMPKEGGKLP